MYGYIENMTTPKDLWNELAQTYDDKGSCRKVTLLQKISAAKLETRKSMEDYVSRIIAASKKLAQMGTKLPTDLVEAQLLAGLPSDYKPMVMALCSSGQDITAGLVKTKLLEEPDCSAAGSETEIRGFHAQAQAQLSQFP